MLWDLLGKLLFPNSVARNYNIWRNLCSESTLILIGTNTMTQSTVRWRQSEVLDLLIRSKRKTDGSLPMNSLSIEVKNYINIYIYQWLTSVSKCVCWLFRQDLVGTLEETEQAYQYFDQTGTILHYLWNANYWILISQNRYLTSISNH